MSSSIKKSNVLYEDNHIIAINKQPSEIVQGDKTGDIPLSEKVKLYLKKEYNKPGNVFLGVVHRIDRPVSGVLLFAKTSKALSRLNESFKTRDVHKTYWAVVEKRPLYSEGKLIHFLKKNEKKNKSFASITEKAGYKRSELNFSLIDSSDRYHLLEVLPKTGRHHQIRVQLSENGTIIKGDLKYGAKRPNQGGFIHLHARKIEFIHPVSKELKQIIAPVPEDNLWQFFEKNNQ